MADADNEDDPGQAAEQPNPRATLMEEVARQMDAIETEFGDDYKIGRVITIIEVEKADGTVELRLRAGQYPWVAMGMLQFALRALEAQIAGPAPE